MDSITLFQDGKPIQFVAVLDKDKEPYAGHLYAVEVTPHGPVLLAVPLFTDNTVLTADDIIEVTSVEDDQLFVDAINRYFGTQFTLKNFPGR
jgi:hypothetical protein